jgi:hypothetical protein
MMSKIKIHIHLLVVFYFIFMNGVILAQQQIVIAVTENNLDFGDAYIGYPKTLNHTDAGAAKFRMRQTVRGNPWVAVNFVLPNSLVNGAYSVPVIFGPSTTAYSKTDSPAGRTNFDPNSTLTIRLQRNDFLYIWLGGVINVPTNIIPGVYTTTITVTITVL